MWTATKKQPEKSNKEANPEKNGEAKCAIKKKKKTSKNVGVIRRQHLSIVEDIV